MPMSARRQISRPTEAASKYEDDRPQRHIVSTGGKAEKMAGKSGLKPRGADVQLLAIGLPQRLLGDIENAGDFSLRDAPRGEHQDETAVGYTGDM
ncbi:hypothetical protein [Rhizobium leguminosarum]|uniref:hypothetical protein n=1 Tax=Rhizobium leguminosarum TaxID=384 RepID=UPI0013F17967